MLIVGFIPTLSHGVFSNIRIKSRKSEELTVITLKVRGVLKPVMWFGILITAVVWFYVLYKDPSKIVGIVNSLLLIILVILSWHLGNKIVKAEFGKLPIFSMTIFVVSQVDIRLSCNSRNLRK